MRPLLPASAPQPKLSQAAQRHGRLLAHFSSRPGAAHSRWTLRSPAYGPARVPGRQLLGRGERRPRFADVSRCRHERQEEEEGEGGLLGLVPRRRRGALLQALAHEGDHLFRPLCLKFYIIAILE